MKSSNVIKEKLSGVFVPIITPFINDIIEYKSLLNNIKKLNSSSIKGYFVLGSYGENKSLAMAEKIKILELFKENKKDKIIIVNASCESSMETIKFGKEAQKRGADFIAALTPSYFNRQINDDVLIDYYSEIAESLENPILLYNAPGFAGGKKLSSKVVEILASHPNIVGIKDSTSDSIMDFIISTTDINNFYILSGSINNFFIGILNGAIGGVLSMANAFPEIFCRLYDLLIKNRLADARKLNLKLLVLKKEISKYGVSGIKALTSLAGLFGGEPRRPLKALNPDQIEEIQNLLIKIGFH